MIDLDKLPKPPPDERSRRRGAWSPRTTLAYCWRSRAVAALGAWLAASPWLLGTGEDTGSTQSAIVSAAMLVGAALWALMSRHPAPAHAMVVASGGWLLLAPSLWYFTAAAAAWNSIATGLAVIGLSGSVLLTRPWTRPLDAGLPASGKQEPSELAKDGPGRRPGVAARWRR